jgi:hypothetical protein
MTRKKLILDRVVASGGMMSTRGPSRPFAALRITSVFRGKADVLWASPK